MGIHDGSSDCTDCKVNVLDIKEYSYMVTSEVWFSAGKDPQDKRICEIAWMLWDAGLITQENQEAFFESGGFLCIGCIEERLGRQLTRGDFKMHLPINNFPWSQSERLRSRIAS